MRALLPVRLESESFVLETRNKTERMRVIRFVGSFAWADLEVRPEQRRFIDRIVGRLELGADR